MIVQHRIALDTAGIFVGPALAYPLYAWLLSNVPSEYGDALHAANLGFHVWTVDDPAQAKRMVEIGVDSITTNRAKVIATELQLI